GVSQDACLDKAIDPARPARPPRRPDLTESPRVAEVGDPGGAWSRARGEVPEEMARPRVGGAEDNVRLKRACKRTRPTRVRREERCPRVHRRAPVDPLREHASTYAKSSFLRRHPLGRVEAGEEREALNVSESLLLQVGQAFRTRLNMDDPHDVAE